MRPFYTFSDAEHQELLTTLSLVRENPYQNYSAFSNSITSLIASDNVPSFFRELCTKILREREAGISDAHVLRNCPIDPHIPDLNLDHPVMDKYEKKKTALLKNEWVKRHEG